MTISYFLVLDQKEEKKLVARNANLVMEFIQGVRTMKIYKLNDLLIKVISTSINENWIVAEYNGQEKCKDFELT